MSHWSDCAMDHIQPSFSLFLPDKVKNKMRNVLKNCRKLRHVCVGPVIFDFCLIDSLLRYQRKHS